MKATPYKLQRVPTVWADGEEVVIVEGNQP